MSSTNLAVSSDSSRPTTAIAKANGAMIRNVSIVKGTFGIRSCGSDCGSSPSSPTVGTLIPARTVAAVRNTTATSGAGTARVRRGNPTMIAIPTATIGYTIAGTSMR